MLAKQRLQMELDSKDSEIEQLHMKLASLNSETASLSSIDNDADDFNSESVFEGWLSIPTKQNIRRHGWKKQYVVVSSKKIIFYNSENDKQNSDPGIVLDLWYENLHRILIVIYIGLLNFTVKFSTCVPLLKEM